jgi:tyrosine-protein phosphatase SIW14
VPEEYSPQHRTFVDENEINHVRIRIQANKDPFVVISQCDMASALGVILDKSNHPILIHCNRGKVKSCVESHAALLANAT